MTISFTSVAVIAVVAVLAPLAIGAARLPLPAVVLEILLGIAVGPQALGWAQVDEPVAVLSTFGLAFLLLLAGLEIDFELFRGRLLRLTVLGYVVSFGIALLVGLVLRAGDLVRSPLLIAIILSATGLGVILPILKDAGQTATPFGQVVSQAHRSRRSDRSSSSRCSSPVNPAVLAPSLRCCSRSWPSWSRLES